MTRRSDATLPRGLERALHGLRPSSAASDALRTPEEWELVVAAAELALLGREPVPPPADLGAKLTHLLDSSRKPSR